jgi:hypothetical protein
MYQLCSEDLGRPKKEVMSELFSAKQGAEFAVPTAEGDTDGEGDIDGDDVLQPDEDEIAEQRRHVRRVIEHEVAKFIDGQIARGEEPDEDLIIEMDSILEEG